ncbi:hypothetical protein C6A87_003425 [Mycobacterium sp. ITM-2016-00317]|uniref:hypothetical protein n=1 Tax=Mycobacterium sp. ITM-2016-00317 TaxID=2099694 RepID=UPI00287F9852|nr:hypothetical protein [Mycobacterium sp. ITM-2016-00317]WNG88314.1 hypothetical protein C6A87_003425 [Mycobacterium sp. ITM-2016-00317]
MSEDQIALDAPAGPAEIPPRHVPPVVIPAVAQYVSRWRFALIVIGMWIVAAAAGAGLYYWWYHSLDKAVPVFAVLVFVIACVVGSLLSSMVQDRPGVAAMAVAMMSAPMAAGAGAALLYAAYVFGWIPR